MSGEVFISYSSKDQERVLKLAGGLSRSGVSIWVDQSGIGAATLWSREIAAAIKACKVFVLMVSPNSVASNNVAREVSLASEQNKPILPVILEQTPIQDALAYHLAGIQHLDLSGLSEAQSEGEVLPVLERLIRAEGGSARDAAKAARRGRAPFRRRLLSAWKTHAQRVATVGAVGVTAALVWFLRPPPPPRDPPAVRQVEVILKGEKPRYAYSGNTLAISRDGCRLVYSLNRQDAPLHLLFLDSGVNRELSGTEGGVDPFISPDGQHVGFTVGKQIKTASLESGGIRDCGVTNGEFGGRGASWGDGRIVYSPTHDGSLWTVRPEGGEPSRLTRLAAGEFSHRWPQCLPGGEHVLFMAGKPMASQGKKRETQSYNLEVIELATGVRTVIKERCAYGRYSRSGHIFFVSKGNLYVQAFDLGRLALEGERRLLREGVAVSSWEAAQFAASDDGTLVYSTGGDLSDEVGVRKLVWVGSDGGTEEASAQRGGFLQMDLSPDGGKVALAGEDWTILLLNLETDQIQRLTLGEGRHSHPVWDAVGESVLFVSDLGEEWGVWERKADFSAAAEPLFSQPGEPFAPRSLSADGGRLYGTGANAETGMDVWVFARAGASARPTFVVREPGFQGLPDLSPQGWLVFQSGSALNVVHVDRPGAVQPLPIPEGSKDPRWSPDGDRLYYDNGSAVWSVAVTPQGETLRFGTPARRFKLPSSTLLGQWEVDPGGERLLVLVIDDDPTSPRGGSNSVHIVFNWESELREPAPGGDEH